MFESGRKAAKQAKNNSVEKCELPTIEQVFQIWDTYFEPLLKSSDNHNPELLAEFENDILQYVKTKISIV
jgi:hypothetical protein